MATRTIGTEIVLAGEKKFNDAMKGVNSNLRNMRADMARVTAEFDGNEDSVEALTAKEKILQGSVEQHRAKVNALREMYERQKKEYGENSDAADKYKLQLTQATTAMLKEEKALGKTKAAIAAKKAADLAAAEAAKKAEEAAREAAEAAARQAKEDKEAAAAAERLAKKQREAAEAAERAAKKQKEFEERLKKTEERAEKLRAGLGKLGTATVAVGKAVATGVAALAAAGGVALTGMISMATEAAEAAKAAKESGQALTPTQYQWLAFSNQLESMSSAATKAKSALASILLPSLMQLSVDGTNFLNEFSQAMKNTAGNTEKQTQILSEYIAKGAKLIAEKLPEYFRAGSQILSSIAQGFGENSDELLDMGLDLTMKLLDFVVDNAPALAEAGIELAQKVIEGIDGVSMAEASVRIVDRIAISLADASPKMIPAAVSLIEEFAVGLVKNSPMLLESVPAMIWEIVKGLNEGLEELRGMGPVLIDALIEGMRRSDSKVFQFGADAIEWIKNGILAAWDDLVSWFNNLWDNLFTGRDVDVNVNPSTSGEIDGSHAAGLRYVPFDGYLAQLHRGEAVLPADEADAYRAGHGAQPKVFNLTINTKSITKEDMDMLVSYMNGKLGAAL